MTFAAVFVAAWTIAGFRGAPPAVTVDPSLAVYAEARPALVAVSSDLYADATGDQQQRVNAAAALIHEFAHERQRSGLAGWLQESSAEAFSRDKDVALRHRFGLLPDRWAYASGAQAVWMFGIDWIRRGQFA